MPAYDSFHQFFEDNKPNGIRVIPTIDGQAFDIALIIDGGYAIKADAEDVADLFRHDLTPLFIEAGIRPDAL